MGYLLDVKSGIIVPMIDYAKKWTPLILLLSLAFIFFYFHLHQFLTFKALKQYHTVIQQWTQSHYFFAVLSYMLIYILVIAISIPGATFLTVLGGFLFGIVATLYVVISATLGAVLLFLAIHTAIGDWLIQKATGWIYKMEKGFRENAFNYLLVLRLIPLFPFWLINIVPALLNVPLRTFTIATFIGIIPGSFIYVMVGRGLGKLLAFGQTPNLNILFTPAILIPLVGLAALAVLPVIYKRYKGKSL